jgi:hypothetical protein
MDILSFGPFGKRLPWPLPPKQGGLEQGFFTPKGYSLFACINPLGVALPSLDETTPPTEAGGLGNRQRLLDIFPKQPKGQKQNGKASISSKKSQIFQYMFFEKG